METSYLTLWFCWTIRLNNNFVAYNTFTITDKYKTYQSRIYPEACSSLKILAFQSSFKMGKINVYSCRNAC